MKALIKQPSRLNPKHFRALIATTLLSSVFSVFATVSPASARQLKLNAIKPGETVTYKQTIPIRIVYIGEGRLDRGQLRSQLPQGYVPVVRYPRFYGLEGRNMGLSFDFKYRIVNTSRAFEDRFFNFLSTEGKTGPRTAFQTAYNEQTRNVLDVSDNVLYIDAPWTEKWLMENDPQRDATVEMDETNGVANEPDDAPLNQRGYTVYFINWHGRSDFKFHVYTKTDEPDPDTGYNFGELRGSRKMIAWGGLHSRSWFYDLSAGPDAWTFNYNVDDADVDGDGVDDYRIPPIWEYTAGGYRDPSALSADLGKLTRFVGINLLFTTSPLYDPMVTVPKGGAKTIYLNMLQADPTSNGLDYQNDLFALRKWQDFQPYHHWQIFVKDRNPIDDGALRALNIFEGALEEDDCWNSYGLTFAQLFCYFDTNYASYIPGFDPSQYVIGLFNYNITDGPQSSGLLGFADDNWTDGTQSYVFSFDSPGRRASGYGFTITNIHEVGHHIGVSHPHDGYDSELGLDYGPGGDLLFTWAGDESATVMSYLDLTSGFGIFDRDNMHRYEFAGYANLSNELAKQILDSSNASAAAPALQEADQLIKKAQRNFKRWEYLDAATNARRAYETLLWTSQNLGVNTMSPTLRQARQALSLIGPVNKPDIEDPHPLQNQ
jgi:hypothetical protein